MEKFRNQRSLLELKENEQYNLKKFAADAFRYAKNMPKEEADGDSSAHSNQKLHKQDKPTAPKKSKRRAAREAAEASRRKSEL